MDAKAVLRAVYDNSIKGDGTFRQEALNQFITWIAAEKELPAPLLKTCATVLSSCVFVSRLDRKLAKKAWASFVAAAGIEGIKAANAALAASSKSSPLVFMEWTCVLVKSGAGLYKENQGEWEKLVALQAEILNSSLAASRPVAKRAAELVAILLNQAPELFGEYAKVVKSSSANAAILPPLAAVLVSALQRTKAPDAAALVSPARDDAVNNYITNILSAKKPQPAEFVEAASGVLRAMTLEEFEKTMLPAIDRSLKRSTEVTLLVLPALLSALALDLSKVAKTIATSIAPLLVSVKDVQQQAAQGTFAALAKKTNDPAALQDILTLLLDAYAGKHGKVSQWEQRSDTISALQWLSKAPLAGKTRETFNFAAVEKLIPLFQKESHEATKVQIMDTMTAFVEPVQGGPAALDALLPTLLADLKAPAPVRLAALTCAAAAMAGESLPKVSKVLPSLLTLVDTMAPSPAATAASEVCMAATLVVRLHRQSPGEVDAAIGKAKFWTHIGEGAALGKKFFAAAGDAHMIAFLELAELMVERHLEGKDSKASPAAWYAGLVTLALAPSYTVRKRAISRIVALLGRVSNPAVRSGILAAFNQALADWTKEANREIVPSANAFEKVIIALASPADSDLLSLLIPSHHALLLRERPSVFGSLLHKRKQSTEAFVLEHTAALTTLVVSTLEAVVRKEHGADWQDATLTATKDILAWKGSAALRKALVEHAEAVLGDKDLLAVGALEYKVFQTPEGRLAEEMVDAGKEEDDEIAKLDKNSKDYADKKWELEVKRELAKKKGIKLPKAEPKKLTKQQEDLRNAKLARETALRARVATQEARAQVAFAILDTCIVSRPSAMNRFVPSLTAKLVAAWTRSALVSHRACDSFVLLSRTLSSQVSTTLALTTAHTIIRINEPQHGLPAYSEPLSALTASVMRSFWSIAHEREPLDEATFSYVFPLVEHVLRYEVKQPAIMEDALVFLNDHAIMGRSAIVDRPAVVRLLTYVIAHHERLAHQASVLLVEFCAHLGRSFSSQQHKVDPAICMPLLDGLVSEVTELRSACLKGLAALPLALNPHTLTYLWLATHDTSKENSQQALDIWSSTGAMVTEDLIDLLLEPLASPHEDIEAAAAAALGNAVKIHPDTVAAVVQKLIAMYRQLLVVPDPERDSLGNIISKPFIDPWQSRRGIAKAFSELSASMDGPLLVNVLTFFVDEALGDRNADTQSAVLRSGMSIIDSQGKAHVALLLPILEEYLASVSTKTASHDDVRQSVVVLLGSLAQHLASDDPKVPAVVDTLLTTLTTPSETVQEAVSLCLTPLIAADKSRATKLITVLLEKLLEGDSYGDRRGAAYGLAGVVKGAGILALKQNGIMDSLQTAIQDKKNQKHRESALMGYELLCNTLARLFEPYVIHVLPNLLICFGDTSKDVRAAAQDTSRAIMSKLSGHGVKLVLPSLLDSLQDDVWRTKQAAAQLLGAMAYCAPKQLSSCLPSVVPKLIEVLTDSHQKVQEAGKEALDVIGSVIKNPEIQNIVPVIMSALIDPTTKTNAALSALLETAFVHVIDAASLALIMPIVQRAMSDRSTEIKKKASQIIGNMYSLTDAKDLAPYLPAVLPSLKVHLVDPVPEARSVAAKSLGSMVKGMGEAAFPDLLPWLLTTLRTNAGSVDRSGAAQGLSEVLFALGKERLVEMMPDFLKNTSHPDANVREGHLLLMVYFPVTFGEDFRPYVDQVIPCVLKGLADVEEGVRDTAMKGGQRIITNYADTSVELLLPQLLSGLYDENFRIRESSVMLLGDLLYRLSGVTGMKSTDTGDDEDDSFGTEASAQTLIAALGYERRNKVLAALYVSRQDTQYLVRQASLHVWKVVVTHTVRTLKEILPQLMEQVLHFLADDDEDKRTVAARSLGELVRKLGERILPDLFPMLEAGLETGDDATRQGVCVGLSEIMNATTEEQIESYSESLVPAVRKALCDPLPAVREAAAETFANLHSSLGPSAIDGVIPKLLTELRDEGKSEYVLDGLRHVMALRSKVVLPYLVPHLTVQPMSDFNARALASLVSVAGPALNKHLPRIMRELLSAMEDSKNEAAKTIREATQTVVASVDEDGAREVVPNLLTSLTSETEQARVSAAHLIASFCQDTEVDLTEYSQALFRGLLDAFLDTNGEVVSLAWAAMDATINKLTEDKASHLKQIISAIRNLRPTESGVVPGFCIPRGLQPFIPLFTDCLLSGSPDTKELAAEGLGLLVERTSEEGVKPFIVKITGPLIRVFTENAWRVKAAILSTVCIMLEKLGDLLKAFLPQLQPTCTKALRDTNKPVRVRAARAIAQLMVLQREKRVDPLLNDIISAITQTEDNTKETALRALAAALRRGGETATEKVRGDIEACTTSLLADDDEEVREAAGRALGTYLRIADDALLEKVVSDTLLEAISTDAETWTGSHGRACALHALVEVAPERVFVPGFKKAGAVMKHIERLVKSENLTLSERGMLAAAAAIGYAARSNLPDIVVKTICPSVCEAFGRYEKDQLYAVLPTYKATFKSLESIPKEIQSVLLPPLLALANGSQSNLMKKTVDKVLVYLLQMPKGDAHVNAVAASLSPALETDVRNHIKKSLAKRVTEESDEEDSLEYGRE